ncbi:unnamed protein product [Pieris brassicae]|uniref:Secreted protein n=1 Tax=Pieris brassicae TaxID=7116 RepID=A0A9P0TD28_PIEBR|nr:unnamed protein product [Pieris brassicae]
MKPVIISFVLLLLWSVIAAQDTTDCPGCSDMTRTPADEMSTHDITSGTHYEPYGTVVENEGTTEVPQEE